jgi:glycosyltransferase involved in cell wall biosynthesis
MKRRLVLLTEIIAPYRIPVFNALAHQAGIDLHVIFLSETDTSLRQWRVYHEEIQFSYEVLPSWRRRVGKHPLLINRDVAPALEQAAPDVVLCGGYSYLASWQSLYWARRNHVPFLAWVESTLQDHRSRHALVESAKARFLRSCQGFVVPGKSAAEYVRSFGIARDRIFTAPNAVDTAFFSAAANAAREAAAGQRQALGLPERFYLFVGRLVKEKGVFELLDAYAALPRQIREEVSLVLVGDGEVRAELEERAARMVPGRVYFPGFVHREQLAAYYGLAETFIFPTHTDTWGLVVNEAMACGLPLLVSSAAGCAADLLAEGENGLLVRPHDPVRLSAAMQRLACSPGLRRQMGQASRRLVAQYSPSLCATGIAEAVLGTGALACA